MDEVLADGATDLADPSISTEQTYELNAGRPPTPSQKAPAVGRSRGPASTQAVDADPALPL
jgi:hypothetical protein